MIVVLLLLLILRLPLRLIMRCYIQTVLSAGRLDGNHGRGGDRGSSLDENGYLAKIAPNGLIAMLTRVVVQGCFSTGIATRWSNSRSIDAMWVLTMQETIFSLGKAI